MDYTRPVTTETDVIQARMDAQKLIRKYGMGKAQIIIQLLCLENVRLTREINEHRAARGIAPLDTFEV